MAGDESYRMDKMIKSFHIANFQSHRESHLDFAPGLNVILGESDAGKTAILRALYWLCANRPSGEGFRSWWGRDTGVGLDLDEGEVSRLRTKNVNTYVLGNQVFKALGTGVPEEVVKVLNMTDINWQMQFQPAFLLTDSPGEVARKFNEIVKLDVIDRSISRLNSHIRQNTQAAQAEKDSVQAQKQQLGEYDYLEAMEERVARVESLEREWVELREEHEQISLLVSRIEVGTVSMSAAEGVLEMEEAVDELILMGEQRTELEAECQELDRLLCNIQSKEKFILIASEAQDHTQQEFDRLMPPTCPLCNQEVKR